MPIKNSKIHKSVEIYYPDMVNIYGCKIGALSKVGPFVEIQEGVSIGKKCKISSHTFICEGMKISDEVFIGHSVIFINDRYPESVNKKGKLKSKRDWKLEKTQISKGVSIGSGTVIMCGIKIGKNVKIGAGSLITKDIPSNKTVYNKRINNIK